MLYDGLTMSAGLSQKAPSAKRRIKTGDLDNMLIVQPASVRKHRVPKGAFRHGDFERSTVRISSQKAPSARRHIKTSCQFPGKMGTPLSESTEHQKVH